RNRIRYALKTTPKLALNEDPWGRPLAGLAGWMPELDAASAQQLAAIETPDGAAAMPLAQLLSVTLDGLGRPVLLDDLTSYLGNALGGFAREENFDAAAGVAAFNLAEQMDRRAWLTHLWTEILELPLNQRIALLLNLRDHIGDSALRLLPAAGVASIRQIAAAMGMEAPALAALWNQLPLDDLQIGERLSLTRQQIANLRKSARERLARRMGSRR
ncbi:MAG TPA: hypothetical protein VHC90_21730, partial [Bryobacteraceae bacterium]|nr:hypothetical protein [Bryobacteraceae bacterium]